MDVTTRAALGHLREAGRARRRARRRDAATAGYALAILAAFLVVPRLPMVAGDTGWGAAVDLPGLTTAPAVALPALGAALLLLAVRDAAWRGPVGVDQATACWALPQPLDRRRLLLPRLVAAGLRAALVGALLGAAAGLVLGALPEATAGAVAAAAAGAWAGGTLGLGCVVVGVAVERHDRVVLRAGRRLFRVTWAVVVALTVPAVCALFVELPAWAGQLMLVSGPWGWGVQPLVAVTGGSAPLWIPAVLAQTAALAVAGVWCAREVGRIPGEALRRRARVAESVAASVFSLDLRGAGRAIRAAHPGGG
ncbi:DUF6297 family protein, partial [Streptomyces otsuchiensis]|uniref:DUF6297 family protein n=1 Tax=Streptomyces otsuchiensis TaxID=2681388 RepID=UPI001D131637